MHEKSGSWFFSCRLVFLKTGAAKRIRQKSGVREMSFPGRRFLLVANIRRISKRIFHRQKGNVHSVQRGKLVADQQHQRLRRKGTKDVGTPAKKAMPRKKATRRRCPPDN